MLFLLEVLTPAFFTSNRILPNSNRLLPNIANNIKNQRVVKQPSNRLILQQTVPTRREQLSQMIINREKFLNNVNAPIKQSGN